LIQKFDYHWVFFDFDGTIAESSRGMIETMQMAIQALQLPQKNDEAIRALIGPPLPVMIRNLFPELNDATAQKLFKLHRKIYAETGWTKVELYHGIRELLEELVLNEKILGIVSLKPEHYVFKICELLEISQYFERIVGVDLTNNPITDKKVLLLETMNYLGALKKESIMIGDTESDIKAANDCDMHSIGVTFGFGDVSKFVNKPKYVANNSKDLQSILLKDRLKEDKR